MSTRTVLIAISLCGALACDGKVEPLSTLQNTQPPVLRVFVPTTLIQPLERVSVLINLGSAADAMWTSSDESVATISRGILTGVSPGEATITAVVGGLTGSAVVHIGWRPEARLFLGSPHFFLDVGTHVTLYPTVLGSSGRQLDSRDVEWTMSNPSIARVDSSGALIALAAGTTTLVGRFRGIVDSAVVEVGVIPRFGYFYSGDAAVTDADYYGDEIIWMPAPGKSFSTAGSVSARWEPPYSSMPDLGWVGPNMPLRDAFMHVVSLENVPCTAYVQADAGNHFVAVGSPLVDCAASTAPQYQQSVRMEFVAFRPGEFSGTIATIRPGGPNTSTSVEGIIQTSATTDSRTYALPGVARDSVFWFVTAGGENVAGCQIAPSDGSLSHATVRVTCSSFPYGRPEPLFYAVGFGADARHAAAPIGFAEVRTGVITRKAVDGLDIATFSTTPQLTEVIVSGAGLTAFDRLPAVLVTAIGLNSGTCGITEPQSTPTTVKLTVRCTAGVSGFTLGVIY